ncbi:hypothetical protein V8G54_025083 [Vigna mungo]|uniref:Uncharacterized protein n=1 Tax=Vigna mungo TaxID=3915 RepID=A0AAQ3RRX6_VIGMU
MDYPSDKLAVYLSDDGGCLVTLYGMKEAGEFTKERFPFCRKYVPKLQIEIILKYLKLKLYYLLGVGLEPRRRGLFQCHGETPNLVVVRTTLEKREDSEVDFVLEFINGVLWLLLLGRLRTLPVEDHARPGTRRCNTHGEVTARGQIQPHDAVVGVQHYRVRHKFSTSNSLSS